MNNEKMGVLSKFSKEEQKAVTVFLSKSSLYCFKDKEINYWFENEEMFELLGKLPFGVFLGDKPLSPRDYLFHVLDDYCRKNDIRTVFISLDTIFSKNISDCYKRGVLTIQFNQMISMLYSHFSERNWNTKGIEIFAEDHKISINKIVN
ncbi:hypothetical protein AB3Z07_28505 (plasmid) [Metabacillus halosaccharovorans]|uniref:hypothetical protein n=1 Tax=Metabacillus halosaccharovorans TaxID=930124 RepID=UPI001C1FF221|nr:hypothetical protein [Metabacillus halosaccharovorans]MBU7595828.1 hypothetical protein [Metabacillus halosaccharovorans]MCM3441463.1 hypothetical protein [Metabacillus halosaccharovorans]